MKTNYQKPLFLFIFLGIIATLQAAGQPPKPKGLIVYKNSNLDSSDRALTIEYVEIEIFPRVVNCKKTDGTSIRIITNNVIARVEYPDLANGTFRTPEQIESVKSIGKEMVQLSEKFPSSKIVITPRIEELWGVATKLNEGLVLSGGNWHEAIEMPESLPLPSKNTQNQKTFAINGSTVSGEVTKIYPDSILLRTEKGVIRVPLSVQSDEIKKEFGYDPEKEKIYNEGIAHQRMIAAEADREAELRKNGKEFTLKVLQADVDSGFLAHERIHKVTDTKIPTYYTTQGTLFYVRLCKDAVFQKAPESRDFGTIADGDVFWTEGYVTDEPYRYTNVLGGKESVRTLWIYKYSRY
jgi:hypothetical protein